MQAKLILIAAAATMLISAVVIGFSTMFGSGASGNFKITARQYIDLDSPSSGPYEEISASHVDGSIKFSYTRVSKNADGRVLLQLVGDMSYEYAYKAADANHAASEWVLVSCNQLQKGVSGIAGVAQVNDITLSKLDADTFMVGTDKEEIFTIHMANGVPSKLTKGSAVSFDVTSWAQDAGEMDFQAAIPASNAVCDGSNLLSAPGGRRLDATGYIPNQDHWWVSVVGFAKWEKNIGYGSVVVNNDYMNKMGFTFVERVVRSNAHGVFFKHSNGGGCGVAIAGTDDGTDAMQDVTFSIVPCYGGGSCHKGFMDHYNLLKADFERLYNSNGSRERSLFLRVIV